MGKKAKKVTTSSSFIDRTEQIISRHSTLLLWIAIGLYIIFSILTFNLRVSEGGDDSTYIIRAFQLIHQGKFPSYQGPLYPTILSLFLLPFGLSVGFLKISSWLFLTAALWFLFKAFRRQVSVFTLAGTLFILIVNHHFLYFASQTYSEAFFMMLQGLFLLMLFKYLHATERSMSWQQNLVLALLMLALTLTRTIGVAALPALLIYLAIRSQWRDAGLILLFFVFLGGVYLLLKYYLWNLAPLDGGQATSLFYKHPYDFSKGKETLGGFINRFIENSNIYLSKQFLILTGFKPALSLTRQPFFTLLLYALFTAGLIKFAKAKSILLFIGIYLATMLGVTFVSLQTLWDQSRLIMPFFPLILLFLIETLVRYTQHSKNGFTTRLPVIIVSLSLLLTFAQTIRQTDFKAFPKYLAGDRYYGYTPDWQNYLNMAEYIGHEMPESYIACRKPSMASIYANGKKFYGIYRFQSQNPDTLILRLKEAGVTHIIAASLRKNPRVRTGSVINTIHRYMKIIDDSYPEFFILQKKMGKDEPAWLFRINYSAATPSQPIGNNKEAQKHD